MNNIMKSYQDLVDCMPKFSIHEMEKLLKNHDDISKDLFIKSFLRYVFSITYKLYKLHQNELNGFYDFEDFFADAVLCATKLYNSGKYAEYKDAKCSNFNNFVNNFRYLVGSLIARTYPVSVHMNTYIKLKELERVCSYFYDLNGYYPNKEELSRLTDYSIAMVKKYNTYESIENIELSFDGFEDEILDRLSLQELTKDVHEALNLLTSKQREVIMRLYGIDKSDEEERPVDIAESRNISRNAVYDLDKVARKKIKKFIQS